MMRHPTAKPGSKEELIGLLEASIEDARVHGRGELAIIAGHMPLIYDVERKQVRTGENEWMDFTHHTFKIAAELVKKYGGRIAVVVDHHIGRPVKKGDNGEPIRDDEGNYLAAEPNWVRRGRERVYEVCALPERLQEVLEANQLGIEHLMTQSTRNGESPLISEHQLKMKAARLSAARFEKPCAKALYGLIAEYITGAGDREERMQTRTNHIIAMVPGQCSGSLYEAQQHLENVLVVEYPHVHSLGYRRDASGQYKNGGFSFFRSVMDSYLVGGVKLHEPVKP